MQHCKGWQSTNVLSLLSDYKIKGISEYSIPQGVRYMADYRISQYGKISSICEDLDK